LLDNNPISANSLGKYFQVNGSTLARQYKEYLSGYWRWDQLKHAEQWVLFPENLGEVTSIDEVSLSDGELYTVVTNAKAQCQKGSLVAMIKGVRSCEVSRILDQIPLEKRKQVKEVTLDLAPNMEKIARDSFSNATLVSDRFHVQQLPSEALQEMRIKHRWEAIEEENKQVQKARKKGKPYVPEILSNGDTKKQLLARSRYLLYKPTNKWTSSQIARAAILFSTYPELQKAYELTMMFRNIYETSKTKQAARERLTLWYEKIKKYDFPSFITAANSIQNHQESILAYFNNRSTNALAENFNSKIKAFRSVFRGVSDVSFFIYRLTLILA
jgi:transposase